MNNIKCFKCLKIINIDISKSISRKEECSYCNVDIHCCKMCTYYDKSSYNECREPSAERVLEKEKANFCDYFKIGNNNNENKNREDLIKNANKLFKD